MSSTEFTARDGARLRIAESGPADAPVTAVLVHGWTLASGTWDGVVERLPGEVRALRFDLRGQGGSAPAEPGLATIERCADDLAELIESRVPSGRVLLAGHSMGGMTIMALAERHPELLGRVSGIALVGTSAGDLSAPDFRLSRPAAAVFNAGERLLRARLAASRGARVARGSRWLRPGIRWLLFGTRPQREHVAAAADWVASTHPASTASYRESLAVHERLTALERIAGIPTVILAGTRDRLTPVSHAQRIADALPEAELVLYPGAGHMLPMERADEVASRVASLLASAPSASA
ncbi:alpha/beta fold hydrolase [Saccharopolyspora griseoalba]|uniref:Alpha/beta fold hydrolase n=1 Tax=Saccharopolyspora griseoalba TaxID=1431848 RepID=A0ABW2LPR7_9PSEU